MAAAQNGDDIEVQRLEPEPVVSIRTIIRTADLPEAVGERISALSDFFRQTGARPAGPPFVRYFAFGEAETDFELGVPVAEPVAGRGPIAAGKLPAGPAVATWHVGPHDRLGEAYARLEAWLREHGHEPAGPAREVYHWLDLGATGGPSEPSDPSTWRTQLIQPFRQPPLR